MREQRHDDRLVIVAVSLVVVVVSARERNGTNEVNTALGQTSREKAESFARGDTSAYATVVSVTF